MMFYLLVEIILGIQMREVINLANQESRLIITFDSDYGELIFKKNFKPTHGVVYLRWQSFQSEAPGIYLNQLFSESNLTFRNKLTVVSSDFIRQRSN